MKHGAFLLSAILILGLLGALPLPAGARPVPFPAAQAIATEFDGADAVLAVDIDLDGDVDVLAAAGVDDAVAWWESDGSPGDGGWTEHTITTGFNGASAVAAADVDRDGWPDVAATAADGDAVTWWESDGSPGDGGWTEHTITTGFNGASALAVADVDRDGWPDVAAAASDGDAVAWWESDGSPGDGGWTEHTITTGFDGASAVAVADVDRDGWPDVAATAADGDAVTWWESDGSPGDGGWTEHTITTGFNGASALAVADVDRDGWPDVAAAASDGDAVTWWESDGSPGDGGWTEHGIVSDVAGAAGVAVYDLDGDGDPDVLGAARSANTVTWWENTDGSGTAWTAQAVSAGLSGARAVTAADLDGDGDLDVLGAAGTAGTVAWWPSSTIHRSAVYPVESLVDGSVASTYWAGPADIDGDGDLDIVGSSASADSITWWENSGAGPGWSAHTITSAGSVCDAAVALDTGDLDGDGDLDVLCAAFAGNEIAWWENDGTPANGAWLKRALPNTVAFASSLHVADLDGDGDLDVLGTAYYYTQQDGDVIWWESDGSPRDGGWTWHLVDGNFLWASSVDAADLDGDGDMDVLGTAETGDEVAWWENDGTPAAGDWNKHSIQTSYDGARSVYAADLNRDGHLDVFGGAAAAGVITVWLSDGTPADGGWTPQTVDANFAGAKWVWPADLDNDGDLDIVAAGSDADDVRWYSNDGSGGGWPAYSIANGTFDGARSIHCGDLDGDGDLDLLGAAREDNDISWWRNQGGQFALATTDTAPLSIGDGLQDDVLRVIVTHMGRSGDTDEELATLDLLLEENEGDPLSSDEANALIANLHVYRDDGSGIFEAGADTLVETQADFTLENGREIVVLDDGEPNVQIAFGSPVTYFLVAELTGDASSQDPNQFRVTHVTESSSTAEDRDYDIPLLLQYVQNVPSGIVNATPTAVRLLSFGATPHAGLIEVEWETATEVDNAGFNLYRADTPDGVRNRLNEVLIPSQAPGSPQGAQYVYLDEGVLPGTTYYYWLEDVDIYGTGTLHGPATATTASVSSYQVLLPVVTK